MKIKLELMYRCGGNHKTCFSVIVDSEQEPDVLELNPEDEIRMGQYGTLDEMNFFESDIHKHSYDAKFDHYGLEVVEVVKPRKVQVTAKVETHVTMEVEVFEDSPDEVESAMNEVMNDTDYSFNHDQIIDTEMTEQEVSSYTKLD